MRRGIVLCVASFISFYTFFDAMSAIVYKAPQNNEIVKNVNTNKSNSNKYSDYYNKSIDLYKAKKFNQVIDLYKRCNTTCDSDSFYFLTGLSYRNIGEVVKSIQYLNKIKDKKSAINYENSISHYIMGDYDSAKYLARSAVLNAEQNVNPAIIKQSKEIYKLSKRLGKPISFSLNAGLGHDDNVNYTPSVSSVQILGFDILLDKPKKNNFKLINGDLSYRKRFGNSLIGIIGSTNGSLQRYNDIKTRDMLQYSTSNGIFIGNYRYNLVMSHIYSSLYIDKNTFYDNKFLVSNGGSLSFKFNITDKISSNTSVSIINRDFKTLKDRNGKMNNINQSIDFMATKATRVILGVGYSNGEAKIKAYENNSILGYMTILQQIPRTNFVLIGGTTWYKTKYGDKDPVYQSNRTDSMAMYNALIKYNIKLLSFAVSYTHTRNNSNIDGYKFNRSVVMFTTGVQY